jgi:hypothetical protein
VLALAARAAGHRAPYVTIDFVTLTSDSWPPEELAYYAVPAWFERIAKETCEEVAVGCGPRSARKLLRKMLGKRRNVVLTRVS